MEKESEHQAVSLEYGQINQNFRFLADVRFKLLALLPVLGGASVFILSKFGLEAGNLPAGSAGELLIVLLVSAFGFLVTLGITIYDQRNSELYNALIHRAKFLEDQLRLPVAPGGLKKSLVGGQFNERPKRGRRIIFQAGHDLALALIYGPLLGAWVFPFLYSLLRLAAVPHAGAQLFSVFVTATTVVWITTILINGDRDEMDRYHEAAERDGLPKAQR